MTNIFICVWFSYKQLPLMPHIYRLVVTSLGIRLFLAKEYAFLQYDMFISIIRKQKKIEETRPRATFLPNN